MTDFKHNHPLKSLQCLNGYTAREKLKCPSVVAHLLGRVMGRTQLHSSRHFTPCHWDKAAPQVDPRQPARLALRGDLPNGQCTAKGCARARTEGLRGQGPLHLLPCVTALLQLLCPTNSGMLLTSSERTFSSCLAAC